MREIRFRAWDKTEQNMFRVDQITFNKNTTLTDYPHILDEHNDVHDLETTVLLQFTGLHDKNGKEIYEGDIVHGHWYDKSRVATIIFENGSFWIKGSDMIGNTEGFQFLLGSIYGGIEVIGNIYENPELLKDKT